MIVVRTPLRMSFVWWGSDIASFYRKQGWAVLSTSIDKYVYITLNKKFDNKLRLSYSKTEIVDSSNELEHDLAKMILNYKWITQWIEIVSIADIPSEGSWLGSSSSFTIAMLHALWAYQNKHQSQEDLAEQSCHIEIDLCQKPIWKQDQYAAAYGWFNFIEFMQDDSVKVTPIVFSKEKKKELESNLLLFYTGKTRSANNILAEQSIDLWKKLDKIEWMRKMVTLAYQLKKDLENNNLETFGPLLHENRLLKKQMASAISNPQIDERYSKAMSAGAEWWKLLWAWGGGFLVFYVQPQYHNTVIESLKDLQYIPFSFDNEWSKVIYYK